MSNYIAHALSLICRGNGHVKTFWSVGQHCINCAKEAWARGLSNRMAPACHLHDAGECYLSDIPRPLFAKAKFGGQAASAYPSTKAKYFSISSFSRNFAM